MDGFTTEPNKKGFFRENNNNKSSLGNKGCFWNKFGEINPRDD